MCTGSKKFFRISIFLLAASIWSCKKDNSNEQPVQQHVYNQTPEDTTLTDTSFYTDITINGQRVFYISGRQGSAMYYGGTYAENYSGITNDANTHAYADSSAYINFLEFGKLEFPVHTQAPFNYDPADFNAWALSNFATGMYDYLGAGSQLTVENGIVLTWTDGSGVQWKTNIGNQDGNYFNIVKEEAIYLSPGNYISGITVTAVFNCKVYDGNSHMKQITNGRLRLAVWL